MNNISKPKIPKRIPQYVKSKDLNVDILNEDFENNATSDFEPMRNILIIEMLYQTGMRRSELVNLKMKISIYIEKLLRC